MKKRIYFLLIVITALLFTACSMNKQTNDQQNLKLVQEFEKAFSNHDFDKMGVMLSDSYVGYGPSKADSMGKEDMLLNWKYNVENLYDKLEFEGGQHIEVTVERNGIDQEWVSSWGKLIIKYQNRGTAAEIWSNTIYLIEDGKIEKTYIFYNEADALRQAGFSYVFREPVEVDE